MSTDRRAPVLLKDALVLDYLPLAMDAEPDPRVERCDLLIDGGRIAARGRDLEAPAGAEVQDLDGRVVMPGFVNGHTHMYMTMAPGMPAPATTPRSFQEALTEIWWKLDRAFDREAVYQSAVAGAWDSLRCGTTLAVDHHSSLTSVGGSLDAVADGLRAVGMRGALCYEVTDRGGPGSRDTALAENRRWLARLRDEPAGDVPWFRGNVGAHACFTLEDGTLEQLAELAGEFDVGLHIHLGEGTIDRELCTERGWPAPVARLDRFGLLGPKTLLAHAVDLNDEELVLLRRRGCWLLHNGRSNMNYGMGRAPLEKFTERACFGTDGVDGNMLGEMRTSFYRGNESGRGTLGFSGARKLWVGGYRLARALFGEPFGSLAAGAPADFVICNQGHKSPLSGDNWLSLLLFGFHPWDIREVWVDGVPRFLYGDAAPYDGVAVRAAAKRIWDKMSAV